MILIKNLDIYAPSHMGTKDVLIGGNQILAIEDNIEISVSGVDVIDGTGKIGVPGFIDTHVHIMGGGGESSFISRATDLPAEKLVDAGVTTVIGLLGTDGYSRTIVNLIAKTKALREFGLSAYCLTGSYDYPTITYTGDVKSDIMFIDEIIGTKLAMSDHRDSYITLPELIRLAMANRTGGMLSGKAGVLHVHMGDGKANMSMIFEALETSELPITTIRPTHVARKKELFDDAIKYTKMGGYIDITCSNNGLGSYEHLKYALDNGARADRITFSSDGNGSFSEYNEKGEVIKYGVADVDTMLKAFKYMVSEAGMKIDEALNYFTSNVATSLQLKSKGAIKTGADADILILDKELNLQNVIAMGKLKK